MYEVKQTAPREAAPKAVAHTYQGRKDFQEIARYVFDKRRGLMQRLAK
jgi:hypothetical protein